MQTKAHGAGAQLEKWKPNQTEPNRTRTRTSRNQNEPKMDECVWKGSWELLTVRCGERKRRRGNGKYNKANELLRNTQVPGDCLTRCLGCSTLLTLLHSLSSSHSSSASTSVLFVVVLLAWSSNALVVCLCLVSSSMHKLTSYVFPFHLCLRVCVCRSV